ncbi:MAG TPA: LUD domain-containing protein, partial [Candidatus Wallbacteria bacterium]|nr:LUD domain-containing protein [Candidatus Wallbacteria bacterium]
AESGSIAIVENEGNARMCLSLPETHIAIFGVEKLIPRLSDLPYFLDILSKSATGQILNAYTSVAGNPAPGHERHYIIVTRKRFEIAADPVFKEALRCIRCGACQNVCPVFQRISGHGYGFTYGGPIGVMLAPFFKGYTECEEIINASTLCGFCSSVCPMKISISRLIIEHRRRFAEEYDGKVSLAHRFKRGFSYAYRIAMSYYLIRKVVRPFARLYLKLSQKALGYNCVPFWNSFAKRHFIDMPRKTFMEGYFKK